VGFASLKDNQEIDMLYVHPSAAGQGIGTLLCDALEKLAGARGVKSLSVDASDNAADFFRKRGYAAQQRNSLTLNGEWLANTTMKKALGDGGAQP
jgi:putative acetyltransferase